jgi:hypothetical protein
VFVAEDGARVREACSWQTTVFVFVMRVRGREKTMVRESWIVKRRKTIGCAYGEQSRPQTPVTFDPGTKAR